MRASKPNSGVKRGTEGLPATGEPVWVQCEGFRCLAVMTPKGKWKTFYDGKQLFGVVKVIPYSTSSYHR